MMNNDSSYIKMTSCEIIKRCDEIISEITKEREEKNKQLISETIKKRKKWAKIIPLFKYIKPADESSVIEYLTFSWGGFCQYAWRDYDRAKECKAMAKKSKDGFVFMSSDDFCRIFKDEVE